jgi:hypothetical protein
MNDWVATYTTDPATGRITSTRIGPAGSGPPTQAQQPGGDPWAAFPDAAPAAPAAPATSAAKGDPWAAFPDAPPEAKPGSTRTVGTGEAIGAGLAEGLSFGLAPAIAGVAETGGPVTPSGSEASDAVTKFLLGAGHMIADKFSNHPDPAVTEAYNRGREAALQNQQLAQEQHPYAFAGGQLAGALAVPIPGLSAARGATTLARVGRSVGAGAVGGGLYGGGSAVSEGQGAAGIATGAAQGAGAGTLFGAAGAGVAETVSKVANRVGSLFRGAVGDESAKAEAARKIIESIRADHAAADEAGRAIRLDPAAIAQANIAGTPRAIVDTGGERTRALFRSSANVSPEARQAAEDFTQKRYRQQSERVAPYVRDLAGGTAAGDDVEAIKAAARAANKPNYDRAYARGDRPINTPGLEQLMGSEAVPKAMAGAVERGRNRAALDGYGAFNPRVKATPDGKVVFQKGANGLPAYPNLQFWDYTQRELRDMATAAERAGRNEEAATLKGLHGKLLGELDKAVPEFGNARGVAAKFFGAADAHEAGADFVRRNVDWREAGRLLSKMSDPERELFARGFASRLADEIEKTGNRNNVLDSIFLDSPLAKRKIVMALGQERANQLEALLRAESLIDQARKALGNSTTARQLRELGMSAGHGVAGAGAVGALEAVKEHDFEPSHVIAAALLFGAARHGAHVIDDRVARHIGKLLVSSNSRELQRGLEIVTKKPVLMNALRQATAGTARVGAHDIGTRKALAGGAALLESSLGSDESGHHGIDTLSDQVGQ